MFKSEFGCVKLHTTVSYNRQLRVKLAFIFGLALTLAIPSRFGRSRIRRNCGYTLLGVVFYFNPNFLLNNFICNLSLLMTLTNSGIASLEK
jgi:hypothetical protein